MPPPPKERARTRTTLYGPNLITIHNEIIILQSAGVPSIPSSIRDAKRVVERHNLTITSTK